MADPRLDTYSAIPWLVISRSIFDGATTAAFDGDLFIAPFACEVIDFRVSWQTAASAETLMLKKCAAAQAKGSGTDMLASGVDLTATADTVVVATLTTTLANRRLTEGQRLALVASGNPTSLDGVCVQVIVKPR